MLYSLQALPFTDLIMLSPLFYPFPSLDAFGNTNVDVLSNLSGLTEETEEVKGKKVRGGENRENG